MAALEKKVIPLSVGKVGLDTGGDPKVTEQALLRLDNAICPRRGAWAKRPGTRALTGTFTERHMASYRARAVLIGDSLRTVEGSSGVALVVAQADTLSLWQTSLERLITRTGEERYNATVVESGNVRVWSYAIYNAVGVTYDAHLEVYERYSGRLIASTTLQTYANDNPAVRMVVSGPRIYYLYIPAATLFIGEINATTGAIGAAVTTGLSFGSVANQSSRLASIDAFAWESSNKIFVAGRLPASSLVVAVLDPDTSTYITTSNLVNDCAAVGVWPRSTTEAVVVYYRSTGRTLHVLGYADNLDDYLGETTIATDLGLNNHAENISGICLSEGAATVLFTRGGTGVTYRRVERITVTLPAGTASAITTVRRRSTLASRPWTPDDAAAFAWFTTGGTNDPLRYAFIYDVTNAEMVGRALPSRAEGAANTSPVATFFCPTTVADVEGASEWHTALRIYEDADTAAPVRALVSRPSVLQCIEAQDALLIPGSLPYLFDGEAAVEQGFALVADAPVLSVAAGAGALTAGTYYAAVTHEWRDSHGRLHEIASAPSTGLLVALNDRITYQIPYLHHTRRSGVRTRLWRTSANGSIYYLLYTIDNDLTADRAPAYTNGTADATVSANQQLFTTGYVLDNDDPPPYLVQCEHQSRHVVADAEYPETRLRYSKPFEPNVGVEHSRDLTLSVPPEGGSITALASYQDRLLVFKSDRIYVFTGTGKTNTDTGAGYYGPYLVSESVGTEVAKSLVLCPTGLMFAGRDRIYAFTSAGKIVAAGDAVRYYLDPLDGLGRTVQAAVHLPERHMVVWLTNGEALTYDYLVGLWGAWTNYAATDGCEADGLVWYHTTGNALRVEDRAAWRDTSTDITLAIETGWLSPAGLGGWARLYRIVVVGQALTRATLHCRIAYDLDPQWIDDLTLQVATGAVHTYAQHLGAMTGLFTDSALIFEAQPSRQKCSSFRIRIYDAGPEGSYRAYELSGLSVLVGLKSTSAVRVGSTRRMA